MTTLRVKPFKVPYHKDPKDSDIAWLIHAYKNKVPLVQCLKNLRLVYPESRVVLIVDGDGEDYSDLVKPFKVKLIKGSHLFAHKTCHLFVTRFLKALLKGPEPYFFRIDPDTQVWRRFKQLPAVSCLFGTVETTTAYFREDIKGAPNIQGGVLGITRDVAQAVLDSGLLTEENCIPPTSLWIRCRDMVKLVEAGSIADDFVLSWAADSLGYPMFPSSEIRSNWGRKPDNSDLTYAVTHPNWDKLK